MPAATVVDVTTLPIMITRSQLQAVVGISKMKADALLRTPGFPVFRHGRVLRIPREALMRWLERHAGGEVLDEI